MSLQVNKYPNGRIEPIYFDPYGAPPVESAKKFVKDNCGKYLPYTKKDVQSLMSNACGWFCTAFGHFINACEIRSKNLYQDVEHFLEFFDDLNISMDFKKNEYILKMFFQPKDPALRKAIDVIGNTSKIIDDDEKGHGSIDMMRLPVNVEIA